MPNQIHHTKTSILLGLRVPILFVVWIASSIRFVQLSTTTTFVTVAKNRVLVVEIVSRLLRVL
ncbi:hypothetical protein CC77DRAFT_1017012 [Alternaria alternata]|jgi:hypothetical protein|uniref:Uncharacterized protein n=1 Tax=Alternaria alternata TaxID=5599 RepID=A0A177DY40_ALTAL|nr:hypothetical protein CC77DRAFT_1017012 [Alternaria alternata]OAG24655.1 hypothetical protein CC77DRAFT_1017012 [Alternaria alternata]